MRWYENLYVSERASHNKCKSVGQMMAAVSFNLYMITLPSNDNNLLDILSYHEISTNPYYQDVMVVGVASGKQDALELARDIIWDTYSHTGNFKVRDYLGFHNSY